MAAHGKIIDSINTAVADGQTPLFSFEFFPPKTDEGRENLYMRMDRMCALEPLFVDITWGAGGSTAESTMEICKYAQTYFGTNALMHLTCTGMTETQLLDVLHKAKDVGIRNILALQGDAPKGKLDWVATPGGCPHAVDLVRLIRKHFGSHFCIAVGGFPEGHPRSGGNLAQDVSFLKEKVTLHHHLLCATLPP
jgi:methylenetetrahydrofolate reductase (NADPH)